MKMRYEQPKAEIIALHLCDVITASGDTTPEKLNGMIARNLTNQEWDQGDVSYE